jgi:nucleoside-diphosphate kinase
MDLEKDIEFIMLKPNGIRFSHIIFDEIMDMGLKVAAYKGPYMLSLEKAEEHYAMHRGKDFYQGLIDTMMSGPVVSSVLTGDNAIERIVEKAGYWDYRKAEKGTWRERFADRKNLSRNVIHRADSTEAVKREIPLHFDKAELVNKLPTAAIQYLFGL